MAPPKSHPALTTPFSIRAELPNTPQLACYLLSLISIKRSNLCVSADVYTTLELLRLAEEVGDHICILKTHADIIDDWSKDTIAGLQEVAKRKHFLLFEDRKLGDIGNTLQSQYTRGPLQIATWAHLTNAHLLPGPAIVPALHAAAQAHLISLNQTVNTVITAGTPRASLDIERGDDASSSIQTNTTKISKPIAQNESSKTQLPPIFPPATTAPTSPPADTPTQLFFTSHRRNRSGSAYATTTITQHSTPLSPSQPSTLMKSLSQAEEDGEGEDEDEGQKKTPHNPKSLLEDLGPPPHARGLLLLAEMSTEGNLVTEEYTAKCLEIARANREFVVGFVCQRSLNTDNNDDDNNENDISNSSRDNFLCLAPGVMLGVAPEGGKGGEGGGAEGRKGDGKGQQWRDPEDVVARAGIDVVIVGRGILGAADRAREAERYRRRAWGAYKGRIGKRYS